MENTAKEYSLEELLEQLDSMVGLESVKKQVWQLVMVVKSSQAAERVGIREAYFAPHIIFAGGPGTGKTTVARILGGIYNALGLLPSGDIFVVCEHSDLVAEYQGQTADKTGRMIDRAMGGVLFIDEAYNLCRGDRDPFGQEALDTLVAEMENRRGELMVILVGYSRGMDEFLKKNPGMTSRVPLILTFEDYTPEELFEIFRRLVVGKGFILPDQLEGPAKNLVFRRSQEWDFSNARGVRNLMDKVIQNHCTRLGGRLQEGVELPDAELLTITAEDLEQIF